MPSVKNGYVLIVEDEAAEAKNLASALEKKGLSCRIAVNSIEAIGIAQGAAPSVIIEDIVLPGMNGLKLVQLFKSDAVLKDVPIIIVSVMDSAEHMESARRIGAAEYFVKPADYEKIAALAVKLCGGPDHAV